MSGKRGALIVLEGCDRAGKSTQAKQLVQYLNTQGILAKYMRFPDRETVIGKMINNYLTNTTEMSDQAIHLLFSANRWEAVPEMYRSLVEKGETLVVDRYAYSGVSFTHAKYNPGVNNLTLEWCKNPDKGLPRPDLVMFLDLAPEEAAKRGEFGAERYEETGFQKRVRGCFEKLRRLEEEEEEGGGGGGGNDKCESKKSPWRVVDASGSVEEVQGELRRLSLETLEGINNQPQLEGGVLPIGKLWG
eukprot:Nk52_evm1s51 gene=Nk52_evmTU1s51